MRFLCIMLILTGCSTVAQDLKVGVFYKRDIKLTVNGLEATGGIVVPKAASYKIEASTEKGNFDFVIIDTCHRYNSLPEQQGDEFETVFIPRPGIEDVRACPLKIHSFDEKHSRDAYGFIGFESPEFNLPATLECNDLPKSKPRSVLYCETKPGHPIRLSFPEPVYVGSDPGKPQCKLKPSTDGITFLTDIPYGDCLFLFQAKSDPHKKHLLYTYGFSEILPRKW